MVKKISCFPLLRPFAGRRIYRVPFLTFCPPANVVRFCFHRATVEGLPLSGFGCVSDAHFDGIGDNWLVLPAALTNSLMQALGPIGTIDNDAYARSRHAAPRMPRRK